MSLPSPRHRIGVACLIALALIFGLHVPVSGAERAAVAVPAGAFASLEFDAGLPAALATADAESTAAGEPAPLATRSYVALLGTPRPTTRSVELTLNRVERSLATRRPMLLPALYASFAALQVMDFVTTRQGLANGAREANPLMQGVAGNSAALFAVKAAGAAGSIFLAEKMWKRNPVGAIAMMVAMNSVYGIVVGHNYSVVRGLK